MHHHSDQSIVAIADILKLLGDKTRLTMVKIMSENECCVCEFVDLFEMSQPAISQHLRKMKAKGLIKETRKGQWVFYSLNPNHPNYSFVQTVIHAVPSQQGKLDNLKAQGKRITCC